jgi:hypothetical protein
MIFTVVKYLVAVDVIIASAVLAFALWTGIGWDNVLPFCLMLLVASVPVALPATFTLASALGTQELARPGFWSAAFPPSRKLQPWTRSQQTKPALSRRMNCQ